MNNSQSRTNFLLALSTISIAGCAGSGSAIPSNQPSSLFPSESNKLGRTASAIPSLKTTKLSDAPFVYKLSADASACAFFDQSSNEYVGSIATANGFSRFTGIGSTTSVVDLLAPTPSNGVFTLTNGVKYACAQGADGSLAAVIVKDNVVVAQALRKVGTTTTIYSFPGTGMSLTDDSTAGLINIQSNDWTGDLDFNNSATSYPPGSGYLPDSPEKCVYDTNPDKNCGEFDTITIATGALLGGYGFIYYGMGTLLNGLRNNGGISTPGGGGKPFPISRRCQDDMDSLSMANNALLLALAAAATACLAGKLLAACLTTTAAALNANHNVSVYLMRVATDCPPGTV